jgi:hypothetical protein
MNPKRKYQLCGKKPNGKVDVIVEKTSILFASSFIKNMRAKYEKLGYLYLFALPINQ